MFLVVYYAYSGSYIIFLQTNFRGFNISEVIKAGSLGDGTAVPGHYDLDLVIYSRGNNQYSHMISREIIHTSNCVQ